jgi:hypothetical protein
MANVQQLTAGLDNLNGIAGDYNIFQLTPVTLQSTDTVTGGAASPFVDNLEVTATGTLAAAQFQGVTGVEQLILSSAGNDVTLTNGLVAGTSTGNFRVEGGAGGDTVDASAITNFTPVSFIAGTGNDSFKGGNGRSDSVFAANALTSADTVVGGSAADFLYFLTAGAVAVDAFANVSAIEGVVFDSGGNSVTLTDGLVSGSSNGVFRVGGGAGDDVVDASAVSATALTFIAGTGADKIAAGSSNGNYVFADLTAADTVQGGSGIETVDFASAGAVSAADFANVTNIEGLVLNTGGSNVTLTNSLVDGTSTGFFWILGGAGSDSRYRDHRPRELGRRDPDPDGRRYRPDQPRPWHLPLRARRRRRHGEHRRRLDADHDHAHEPFGRAGQFHPPPALQRPESVPSGRNRGQRRADGRGRLRRGDDLHARGSIDRDLQHHLRRRGFRFPGGGRDLRGHQRHAFGARYGRGR